MAESLRSRKVLIVGGGITGLVLAILLERDGHRVTIADRGIRTGEMSGGITLTTNGVAILRSLGIFDMLRPFLHTLRGVHIDAMRCGTLSGFRLDDESIGGEVYSMMRSDLHAVLFPCLKRTRLVNGSSVHLFSQSQDGVSVTFSNGNNEWYDLVAGCDGKYSDIRASLFGEAGRTATLSPSWRFLANNFGVSDTVTIREVWGLRSRLSAMPLPGGLVQCVAVTNRAVVSDSNEQLDPEEFRKIFSGLGSLADHLVAQVTRVDQLIYNGHEEIVLPEWYSGKVVLIGEAAHGIAPILSQGASLAIEDAYVLAIGLRHAETVDAACAWYSGCRRRRVLAIQNKSWKLQRATKFDSSWRCRLRNLFWKCLPDKWLHRDLRKVFVDAFVAAA